MEYSYVHLVPEYYEQKCVDLQLKWPHCESLIEAFTSAVATFLAIALGKYLTAFFIYIFIIVTGNTFHIYIYFKFC